MKSQVRPSPKTSISNPWKLASKSSLRVLAQANPPLFLSERSPVNRSPDVVSVSFPLESPPMTPSRTTRHCVDSKPTTVVAEFGSLVANNRAIAAMIDSIKDFRPRVMVNPRIPSRSENRFHA